MDPCALSVRQYPAPQSAGTSRLFSAASSDSIRFHSNLSNQNDTDLRVSIDNTCTDSLVTALDDEALLITDYMNDMAKSKVGSLAHWPHTK